LLGEKKFDAARIELAECLRLRPQLPEGRAISGVLQKGKPDEAWVVFELSDELSRQQLRGLAAVVLESARDLLEARKKLVPVYRKKIEEAWPGLGERLSVDEKGHLLLDFTGCKQIIDLTPLRGMKLTSLVLAGCVEIRDLTPLRRMPLVKLDLAQCPQVCDLTPLTGMPLTYLSLWGCNQVSELSPLRGMPLTTLSIEAQNIRDLEPLDGMALEELWFTPQFIKKGIEVIRRMKSLKSINLYAIGGFPPEKFWKKYDAGEFNK